MVDEVEIKYTADTKDFDKKTQKSEKGVESLSATVSRLKGPIAAVAVGFAAIGATIVSTVKTAS